MVLISVNIKWDCINPDIINALKLEDYILASKLGPLT